MLVRVASSAARSLLRSRGTISQATGGRSLDGWRMSGYQGMAANGEE
jgi:hypothetical protein